MRLVWEIELDFKLAISEGTVLNFLKKNWSVEVKQENKHCIFKLAQESFQNKRKHANRLLHEKQIILHFTLRADGNIRENHFFLIVLNYI